MSTVLYLNNGHDNKSYFLDLICGCNVITHVMFLGCCLVLYKAVYRTAGCSDLLFLILRWPRAKAFKDECLSLSSSPLS